MRPLLGILLLIVLGYPAETRAAPSITAFTPQSGVAGTLVKIVGTGLDSTTSVQFNESGAESITIISSTHIKVRVPPRATSGFITVMGPTGTTSTVFPFFVLAPREAVLLPFSRVIPNPSRGDVSWRFNLPRSGRTCLTVFNVRGSRVRTLCSDFSFPGVQEVRWDGRDASGVRVPSGVYCGRLITEDRGDVRCVTLVR